MPRSKLFPRLESSRRDANFAAVRRAHNIEQAARTPEERLQGAEALRQLASSLSSTQNTGGSTTDEPPELWLRLRERFRV